MALTTAQIQNAYVAFFNRPADVAGLNYWTNYNGSIADLFNAFAGSQEYKSLFTGQNSTQIVNTVYQNLFGRSPDVAGLNYWVGQLDAGKVTVGNIANAVNAGAQGTDKTIIDNKVAAATSFTTALDTTSEIVGYAQASNATLSQVKTWLSAVTDQASTVTAATAALPALTTTVASGAATASVNVSLTTAQDNITGTAGNDVYTADFNGNANTFESGDVVKGGAGNDTLKAFLGNASNFAINATTDSIENVVIRAQSTDVNGSSSNNNIYTEQVTVDADRMAGVNRWEDNNSRATLVVEDVRIAASQVTKDITIAMVDTDPGHVDFGLYFDQQSLRAGASSTASEMSFQLRDGLATADQPLGNLSVDGVKFSLAGTVVTLRSEAIDNAKTYAELVAAINTAIAATPGAAGVSAKVGATFTEVNGVSVTGNYVVLSDAQGRAFTNGGFTHSENNTGRFTELGNFDTVDAIPVNQPVTATIVLDNVGRGSTGGDLVVGGLSVGDTSTSKGVQVFDITVERSSKLQNISSTNKSLEQVILKNGTTKGDVTVLGNVDNLDVTAPSAAVPAKTNTNTNTDVLPGSENHHDAYGLNDIRVLDASAMTGKVTVGAVLSSEVVKYMNRVDTQVDSNADDAQFVYTLGSNNDSLTLDISSSNLEAAGATARDDFNLVISGGAGDDTITTDIIGPANLNEGNGAFWYQNSKHNANLRIESGTGDDTVTTTGGGDFVIVAGEGNDTVYADNSGAGRGAWIFNAKNNDLTNLAGWSIAEAMDDAAGAGRDLFKDGKAVLYKAQLTVTLSGATTEGSVGVIDGDSVKNVRGFESTVTIETNGYLATQAQINQAIKKAINSDPVLSKLASAQDGPDNTVVVTSKVDGTFTAGDLDISIKAADLTKLSATEVAGLQSAYKTLYANSKLANLTQADLDYIAGRAQELNDPTAAELAATNGKGSIAASDNTINLGTGDDVAVLGTGGDSNDTIVWTGYGNGKDTIVNFTNGGSAQDYLDFSDYLRTKKSESGSVESTKLIPFAANADKTAEANTVTVVKFVESATDKFDALTASKLLSVFNSDNVTVNDPAAAAFGGLNGPTLEAEVGVYPAGTVRDHVVMVENGTNSGVYKIFHLTSVTGDKGGSFATAQEIVTADFGASLMGYVGGYANLGTIVSGLASGFNPGENNPTTPTTPTTPTGTQAATTVDGLGTDATPAALDANASTTVGGVATTAYNFTDNVATRGNVRITNFGADDIITISGGASAAATQALYDSNISSSGADVQISYNNGGQLNLITLVGVNAGGAFVNDVASFNALSVGDLVFA